MLVLGHSLNDDQIVDAIATRADPESVGVTVYGHPSDPRQPFAQNDPILDIHSERLPQATLIPIRFGEGGVPAPSVLKEWADQFR